MASPNRCEMIEKLRDFIFYKKRKKEELIVFFVFNCLGGNEKSRRRLRDGEESKEDCSLFCFVVEFVCAFVFVFFFFSACRVRFFLFFEGTLLRVLPRLRVFTV